MTLNATIAKRYEGRLFVEEGRLHLVLDTDVDSGKALVSSNDGSGPAVKEWDVADVGKKLAAANGLHLDGLTRTDQSERLTEKDSGWHFTSREGLKGPFESQAEAAEALKNYILASQGTTTAR